MKMNLSYLKSTLLDYLPQCTKAAGSLFKEGDVILKMVYFLSENAVFTGRVFT